MANPRKRKAIKDGRMEQMVKKQNEVGEEQQSVTKGVEVDSTPKKTSPPMDSFIAKEIEEIERISSSEKKPTTKKRSTTKKKTTSKKKITIKKKTGGK